jgi:hypothetical protein
MRHIPLDWPLPEDYCSRMMTPEIQEWLAAAVVAVAALGFLARFFRKRKKAAGCGGSCGCRTANRKIPLPLPPKHP